MAYRLTFVQSAEKEWRKLGATIKNEFLNTLEKRLEAPRVESAKLRGLKDCYKIKLRSAGYRLVYKVYDDRIEVRVIGIGRRDGAVYDAAADRQNAAAATREAKKADGDEEQ